MQNIASNPCRSLVIHQIRTSNCFGFFVSIFHGCLVVGGVSLSRAYIEWIKLSPSMRKQNQPRTHKIVFNSLSHLSWLSKRLVVHICLQQPYIDFIATFKSDLDNQIKLKKFKVYEGTDRGFRIWIELDGNFLSDSSSRRKDMEDV